MRRRPTIDTRTDSLLPYPALLRSGVCRMAAGVDFFFDLSSPWTCLAFHTLPGVLERTGARATWRPILVGGVFNAVNPAVYAAREQVGNRRMEHGWKVLKDWARLAGVPMNFPSQWHPAKSIHAMRFCCAIEEIGRAHV